MSAVVYTIDHRASIPLPNDTTTYNMLWQGAASTVALAGIAVAGAVYAEKCRPLISRVVTYTLCGAISILSLTALYLLRQLDAYINENGERALHVAIKANDEKRVGWLLFFGANPNTIQYSGFTPLHVACDNSTSEKIELRLDRKSVV